ncbi:DUF6166 domain-containing protein [Thiomicrolovo sp. ZZH C-3]
MVYQGIFEDIKTDDGFIGSTNPPRVLNIYAGNEKLDLRHDLRKHSVEFNSGYEGSGPAQTAIAVAAHHFGDDFALEHYQQLKIDIVAKLPMGEEFVITSSTLDAWAKTVMGKATE